MKEIHTAPHILLPEIDSLFPEADDEANKVSRRPGAYPAEERIVNKFFTLLVITTRKVVIAN